MESKESQPQQCSSAEKALKLYIYGSRESDQYYHPKFESQSKRPICLTDIQKYKNDEDDDEEQDNNIVRNPLFKASVYKIACGGLHTIVITTEGQAYTFGCNDQGALGREGREDIPLKVELEQPVHMASAGDNHSVFANSRTGSIFFTGSYKYMRGESISAEKVMTPITYRISEIDYKMRGKQIHKLVSGANHTAIIVDSKIYVRGEPETHTTGRRISSRHKVKSCLTFEGVNLHNVQDLWCGGYHNIAKVRKGNSWQYYVWGLNKHGQLGLGNYDEYDYLEQNQWLSGRNIVQVAAGTNFTIVLTQQGQLYGCGANEYSQLGLGKGFVYQSEDEEAPEVNEQNQPVQKMDIINQEKNEQKQVLKIVEQQAPEGEKKIDEGINNQLNPDENNVKENKQDENQAQASKSLNPQKSPAQDPDTLKEKIQLQHKIFQQSHAIPLPFPAQTLQIKPPTANQGVIPAAEIKINTELLKDQKPKVDQGKNLYVKRFRRIRIPQNVNRIKAGAEFCFGWNNQSLYSWGFGMNYVLLNGQQDDESSPFQVKPKIINNQTIYDMAAGAQHVVYLSYPSGQEKPTPTLSERAQKRILQAKEELKKKKRRR